MTEFLLRDKTLTIPTSVDELTPAQYQRFLILATQYAHGMISTKDLRVRWLSYLLGLRLPWTDYREEILLQVESQERAVDGFFDIDGERHVPLISTTRQKVPTLEGWKARGGDMLDGVSWGAFTEALDTLNLLRTAETPEESDAFYRQITRTLYEAPDGANEPPTLLVVAAVNHLLAVWGAIRNGPVNINGEDIDFRIIFQGGGQGSDDKTGWAGVTYEVTSMWDVLLYLYKCKFEEIHRKK